MKRKLSVLVCLLIGLDIVLSNLHSRCSDYLFSNKFSVNLHSTPYGNQSAVTYKKVKHVETLCDCVDACYEDSDCNMAFLFNTNCFSLQCHNYKLCRPLKRKGEKFENSYVVIVRYPEESLYDDDLADSEKGLFQNGYPDFTVENVKDVRDLLDQTNDESQNFVLKACVYGINTDCPPYEECVPKNNRARTGLCQCENGYQRDLTGSCKEKFALASNNLPITVSPSTAGKQNPSTSKNSTTKGSSTVSPVQHLVVSAGDNITLQLPENEVTLSAYALKQLGGDNYKYEWTLISHPVGDETGIMQDQNTKNLKLSKLRAGLYTFKVTVSAENAVGEAMVNVTVLPLKNQ